MVIALTVVNILIVTANVVVCRQIVKMKGKTWMK